MDGIWWQVAVVLAVGVITYLAVMRSDWSTGGAKKTKAPKGKGSYGAMSLFAKDLTSAVEEGRLDPFSGREGEIERVVHILMRRSKNNPLLIGEPGVGKTAIVEGLARRIVEGKVPDALKRKRVLALDVNALVSETKYRGELEKRLKAMTDQIERIGKEVILFIDELHVLEQVGKSEGSLSISDVLKPALARGEMQVVGATTWTEYQQYIRPNAPLDRRFQPVLVDEPDRAQAEVILKGLRGVYESHHGVTITDEAIEVAVDLSDKLIKGRYLPDKAIDLIDEASAMVSIEADCHEKMAAAGAVHAAAKRTRSGCRVTGKQIRHVIDQWIIHGKEERKRDARKA